MTSHFVTPDTLHTLQIYSLPCPSCDFFLYSNCAYRMSESPMYSSTSTWQQISKKMIWQLDNHVLEGRNNTSTYCEEFRDFLGNGTRVVVHCWHARVVCMLTAHQYIFTHIQTHAHIHTHICVCVHVHICIYMYKHICIYIYIYI